MARANVLYSHLGSSISQYPLTTVLSWDTGASFGLAQFKSEIINYTKCSIPVKDIKKVNTFIGIGTTIHRFVDANGKYVFLPCISYHLPTTDVQLYLHKLIINLMVRNT